MLRFDMSRIKPKCKNRLCWVISILTFCFFIEYLKSTYKKKNLLINKNVFFFSFVAGDVFSVQNEMDDDWLWVVSQTDNKSGLVPKALTEDLVSQIWTVVIILIFHTIPTWNVASAFWFHFIILTIIYFLLNSFLPDSFFFYYLPNAL